MSDVILEVTPQLANGQVTWTMCQKEPQGSCAPANSFPAIELEHSFFGKTHDFKITIANDQTGQGIVFAPNPPPTTQAPGNVGPLWIGTNSKPTAYMIDGRIKKVEGAGTNQLTFENKNKGAPVDLHYQLNFVDGAGKPVTAIDPEIKNGGSTINLTIDAMTVVIGAAVLLALVYGGYRLLAGRK